MKNILFILLFIPALLSAQQYYVAPVDSGGNNSNPGTLAEPWATFKYAAGQAERGDTINFRGGTYWNLERIFINPDGLAWSSELQEYVVGYTPFGASGSSDSSIVYRGYPPDVAAGNKPIFDCSRHIETYGYGTGYYNYFLSVYFAEHLIFKDFDIRNLWQLDSVITGAISSTYSRYLTFENIALTNVSQRGFYISGGAWKSFFDEGSTTQPSPWDTWDDTTRFINCDVSNLCDSISKTGIPAHLDPMNGADGWKTSLYRGNVFIFDGCRAWEYTDDAMDLSNINRGKYIINNCWAAATDKWSEGIEGSDNVAERNGISKLNAQRIEFGGWDDNKMFIVTNCIAVFCRNGFDNNLHLQYGTPARAPNRAVFMNNISYGNSVYGFLDEYIADTANLTIYKNNIGYQNNVNNREDAQFKHEGDSLIESNNSHDFTKRFQWGWEFTDTVTVTYDDFYYDISDSALLMSMIKAPRGVDGSLPENPFRLDSTSDLIDAGVIPVASDSLYFDFTYSGAAPDIGPAEYSVDEESSDKYVISVSCSGQISSAIDTTAHTILVNLGWGYDKDNVSAGASHNLTATNFTNPVTVTVTAADESEQEYTMTVTEPSAFNIGGRTQVKNGKVQMIRQ